MDTAKQIINQKQVIARFEKTLALEKLRKRRADTRRKIELGGLVIKSGISDFNKAVILGALDYVYQLMMQDNSYKELFEKKGEHLFLANQ